MPILYLCNQGSRTNQLKEIVKSKYSKFFLAGLVLNVLCAWFSKGFFHVDEHFQIAEFCNYKLGKISLYESPWEVKWRLRSTLMPYLFYWLSRFLEFIGLYSPFFIAFVFRLFSGIAAWFITCRMCLLLIPQIKTQTGQRLLIIMSMLLWFVPFLSVRFSAENMSGLAFLYGAYLILRVQEGKTSNTSVYFFAGLLFGLSCFIRIQLSFAVAGFLLWFIKDKKIEWKHLGIMFLAVLIAVGLNSIIDSLFYGTPTFTPFNYFYVNIVQHKAQTYGISPWYFYITEYIVEAAPPLSVLFLIMFITGVYVCRNNPLVWAIVPFIIMHFFIGHKEYRFLFPLASVFVFVCAFGLDQWLQNEKYKKIHKYIYRAVVIINIPFLIYRTFIPAEATVNYSKYIYYNVKGNPPVLFILSDIPDYTMLSANASFYKNPDIDLIYIKKTEDLADYIRGNNLKTAYYLDRTKVGTNYEIVGYKKEMVYSIYPDWLLKYNLNNWKARTQIWMIYKFTKE